MYSYSKVRYISHLLPLAIMSSRYKYIKDQKGSEAGQHTMDFYSFFFIISIPINLISIFKLTVWHIVSVTINPTLNPLQVGLRV